MDNEWLARYREHNDALAKRLEGTMGTNDRSGAYVPAQLRAVDDVRDVQMAKLFVSRIHRIAARVVDRDLRDELYLLADEIEETLSSR